MGYAETRAGVDSAGRVMRSGKKVGFTCGAFDLFHAGHVLMLEEARSVCDYLVVGLQTDPSIDRPGKNRPVQTLEERWIQLEGCRYVDEVQVYTTEVSLRELLSRLMPDVRILGADWQGRRFTGDDLPIATYFNKREHKWSTTNLRYRVMQASQ